MDAVAEILWMKSMALAQPVQVTARFLLQICRSVAACLFAMRRGHTAGLGRLVQPHNHSAAAFWQQPGGWHSCRVGPAHKLSMEGTAT